MRIVFCKITRKNRRSRDTNKKSTTIEEDDPVYHKKLQKGNFSNVFEFILHDLCRDIKKYLIPSNQPYIILSLEN